MMIGAAPATHELVLWGFVVLMGVVVAAIAHNHWLHNKLKKTYLGKSEGVIHV